jgi:LPXTG-motif cell wall-anchored protein
METVETALEALVVVGLIIMAIGLVVMRKQKKK